MMEDSTSEIKLPFGEKVVWMLPKDTHRRNVSWTRSSISSVRRYLAKNSGVRGFDSRKRSGCAQVLGSLETKHGTQNSARSKVHRGISRPTPETTSPNEIPFRPNVRRVCIRRMDVGKYGPT